MTREEDTGLAQRMDDLRRRLEAEYPEEAPLRRSRYSPDCLLGQGRIWKAGRETITATHELYPSGVLQQYTRGSNAAEEPSLSGRVWMAMSRFTMFTAGLTCKLLTAGINTLKIHGGHNLQAALSRSAEVPLVSMFNHNSCFDDPGLMGGILTTSQLADHRGMRWSVSASEVIFLNRPMSIFWALGKVVPVVRGWGPKQPAIDFLINRLNEGSWVNIFPEAKVIDKHSEDRYKWGVGRMVIESKVCPLIVPIYHLGMNCILPNPKQGESQPVCLRPGNLVTVLIGDPIDVSLERGRLQGEREEDAWSRITSKLEAGMRELETRARSLHRRNMIDWLARWHDYRDLYAYLLT